MLDALLFDLDGTLVRSNRLHARAFQTAFEEAGFRIPLEVILAQIGKGADKLVAHLLGEEEAARRAEALGERHTALYFEMGAREGLEALPGAMKLLHEVKARGLKVVIATASQQEELDRTQKFAGLDAASVADVLVTSTDVDRSKPAPDTILAALAKLGLPPTGCGFVGDTPYDAASGIKAGVACVGISTDAHSDEVLRQSGMRRVFRHPADLLAHLDEALELLSPGPHRFTERTMRALMDEALREAERGLEAGEIPIGSVVAGYDGRVLGRGFNQARRTGTRLAHAEMGALTEAARAVRSRSDLVLVTTLEPCVMCLGAALEAGIETVVWAHEAPENGGQGRVSPSSAQRWPRLVRNVKRARSRALLTRWVEIHPEDAFAQRLLSLTPTS